MPALPSPPAAPSPSPSSPPPLRRSPYLPAFLRRWFDALAVFHPTRYPDGCWNTQELALPVEEANFASRDGTRLHGWHVRAPAAPWTLLWCHGNTGNIGYRFEHLQLLCRRGWDVFLFDYRGYGKSAGRPSDEGLYADAEAAFDWLVAEKKIPAERILIFGQSLGGAVAVELALRRKALGLVLEATLTSLVDVARHATPGLPTGIFLAGRFESISKIARIGHPLLVLHGTDDEIIPFALGRRLFEAAVEPKWFHAIQGATHKDTCLVGGEDYYHRIEEFAVEAERRRQARGGADGGSRA
ncbi:MAG: alpha/beta hydrolase [Planctomycetes bacterium]|nr:alpha/beta hydrolase [Planctomycetota bacterium]